MPSEPSLSTRYDASLVESKWYQAWSEAGLFKPEDGSDKPLYTITIPPPNITGSLHMGHALCYPIQDALGRYRRMRGYNVLVLPGQDHAGIATQSVVDKQLRKEGSSAAKIGREKFIERVWEWREESGNTILNQLRSLGCAFDWDRLRFTLDEGYHQAVLKVFIDWFERGLIYRGKRVVNWDPVLRTSVSDIETERKTVKGKLYYIRYPFTDGSGSITIATTRPETMLADVAVAVNPADERYKGLVGKPLRLPLMNREIPLIADLYPDPAFGTGAVKITPAHDANDYEVGRRHDLPMPVLFDERAHVTELGGPYAGLDRNEARKRVVADLQEQGYYVKDEPYEIAILVSDRSKEVVEPLLSEQWFVSQTKLAPEAIRVVKEGKVRFFPERYQDIYLDWMENIRDWCISRQLWWGHRIPVYYDEQGTPYAALDWEEAQRKAGDNEIVRQDDDVLDTWFSSGLWPFATLGWPGDSADLAKRYPTSVLVTDRNIIYLWVARMIMMGMDFLHKEPFHEVYIYATVLTQDGKRMSKSLGTGVDPIGVIETKGADALRFTLLSQTGANQDIRYSERRTEDSRNFCNKIWNAARFVLMNLDGYDGQKPADDAFEPIDRWLLSRLVRTERIVRGGYEGYDMQAAAQALHQFFWSEYCDWYIEISKGRLADPARRAVPQWVLVRCLESFLKMLHPIMPHITEEIYSVLPVQDRAPYLMASCWDETPESLLDPEAEALVESWLEATRALRALRAELGLAALKEAPLATYEGDLRGGEEVVRTQAWFEKLQPGKPEGVSVSATVGGVDLHLPTQGLVDPAKELARLQKQAEKLGADLERVNRQLENPMFVQNAKPEAVEKARTDAAELTQLMEKLRARMKLFGG